MITAVIVGVLVALWLAGVAAIAIAEAAADRRDGLDTLFVREGTVPPYVAMPYEMAPAIPLVLAAHEMDMGYYRN